MGKFLQTVAAMACLKSLLMVFNFIFWMSGVVILAIGVWMEVELYKYMEMSTEFSSSASYILMGLGSIIIMMASFAFCCTIKGQPSLLYVYGAFLAVIFVMEIAAGVSIYTYRTKLTEGFDKGLNQAMINYYNGTLEYARDFNRIQRTLHCCGNHQFTEWRELYPLQGIPRSCCKIYNCNTDDESAVYHKGCYEKVINFLNGNIGIVAGAAVGIAFFPLVGVFLSCCLGSIINKTKYEQMA